jgi:acyl-CoA synthetase (AMP-forming)/AMP-acid ligase II
MLIERHDAVLPLSHARGPRDVPLLDETIGENLRRTVERFGDREALVVRDQGYRATYRELWDQVGLAARGLLAHGVRKGDRVGIWSPNRAEWAIAQFATARIGAILVTINPAYKPAELEHALTKAGVSLLLLVRGFRQADYVAMLDEVYPRCPQLREALVIDDQWEQLLAAGARVDERACVVVPGEAFDPLATLQAVEAERYTSLLGVPTMFIAELEHPELARFDLSSLRTGLMGGAPCPVEVMKKVRARMHMDGVTIVCGMTETAPVSTQTAVDDDLDRQVSTVGRAHDHVEIKVAHPETGETLPRGVAGEQCTRGYNVMLGYWDDEEATRAAIDADGWMHTGDLAVMDDDGYLRIVGRIKDMLIRGGENVYPREVEEFLLTIPGVSDAHVIGVPSERYGEEVMAWVKPRDGHALTPAALAEACRGRIATYKIPRFRKLVDAFPMTVTGKVQKYRMRAIAAAELGLA